MSAGREARAATEATNTRWQSPKLGHCQRLSPRSAPALLRPASNQALLSVGPAHTRAQLPSARSWPAPATNAALLPLQGPSTPSTAINAQRSPTTTCWPCGNAEGATTHRHAQHASPTTPTPTIGHSIALIAWPVPCTRLSSRSLQRPTPAPHPLNTTTPAPRSARLKDNYP
jgi:hypothetical protein